MKYHMHKLVDAVRSEEGVGGDHGQEFRVLDSIADNTCPSNLRKIRVSSVKRQNSVSENQATMTCMISAQDDSQIVKCKNH